MTPEEVIQLRGKYEVGGVVVYYSIHYTYVYKVDVLYVYPCGIYSGIMYTVYVIYIISS